MGPRYKLLEGLPRELWFHFKNLLHPADVENVLNTDPKIWNYVFKDESWLKLALTFDRCSPVLLGYNLGWLRLRGKPQKLYVALLARDYSGDLRWKKSEFFAALQDGWEYDESHHEIHFSSGLTVNVYEVLTGDDEARLPLEKIFINKKGGVYSEYCFYMDKGLRELEPSQILGHGSGPACKGRDMKNGCKLLLLDRGEFREYFVAPWCENRRVKWILGVFSRNKVETSG
ncbi:hypothetical protein CBS147343_10052 [Aspergillus niger]|uniref:Uncharacterized protein n=1 Tax=Aspergillus niger TaxID=5061 RepID=A0A9W6ECP3_ASPNG|nr:hypothetical protein CBS11350_2824 [Aspergillus niger]KAI2916935.1 hypothetical protein CBS147371_4885 [Aspergillus niger]KAI2984357.1 hypothetical protein CBS147482_9882 [Aspergillus niger]KAI2988555.1 hypothetical protein CBS147344_3887 [Aspergillus niger]KAI3058760.1 hypothetical protein CBS147343_10052 [Aspergillus niger]